MVSSSVMDVTRIRMESNIAAKQLKRMCTHLVAFNTQCVLCFPNLFSTLNFATLHRYSLILFSRKPFRENTYLQVIRHVTNGVRPKRLNVPRMSGYTWNLVQMCWKSNPSERPTMEENFDNVDSSDCLRLVCNLFVSTQYHMLSPAVWCRS